MIEPDGHDGASTPRAEPPTEPPTQALPAAARLCPFLMADAGWRAATAAGEHRCAALQPPTRLAADKQRRLCLTAAHATCPTFLAAAEERAGRVGQGPSPATRPIAMTAPVVLERSRSLLSFELSPVTRRWGELGLVLLMLVALVAVIVARSSGDGTPASGGVEGVVSSPSPQAGADLVPTIGPAEEPTPAQSSAAPDGSAAPSAEAGATPRPTRTPSAATPSASTPTTYAVKRGDTLSGIAARFGVTIAAIQELNGIADPSLIRVGEVLRIP